MKLVREHINEKFTEDSDPIKDMGIGFKDNFDVNKERCLYNEEINDENKKIVLKYRKLIRKKYKNKLVGKIISGELVDEGSWNYVTKSFRVKNITVNFSNNTAYVRYIYVYSNRGKKYRLIGSNNYKLTM
jgi:hypothetical protein